MLAVAGAGASLIGHSFGGAVALETARRAPVTTIAVYEPAVGVGDAIAASELDRME